MIAELNRRAKEWAEWIEGDPAPSVVDYVCAALLDGWTIAGLAKDMSQRSGQTITREKLSTYLHNVEEGARERLASARVDSADSHADKGLEELDGIERDDVPAASARARYRQWLAETADRAKYGRSGTTVNIGISADSIHLDALRAFAPATTAHLPGSMGAIDNGAERAMIRNVNPTP
jgi:hypothetical protein